MSDPVLDGIQRRLRREPTIPMKHVKRLRTLSPPFEHMPPIWQLRIGEHRAFFDVDEVAMAWADPAESIEVQAAGWPPIASEATTPAS